MKNKIIFALLFLLMVSVVSAQNYSTVGTVETDYNLDTGFWNNQTINASLTGGKSITTPRMIPLVADLDGNGVNEIVVLDDTQYEVYTGVELSTVDFLISSNITGTAYFTLFDIDGDGYTEIIGVDDGTGQIEIMEYNGTNLFLQKGFNAFGTHIDGEVMLACRDVEDCLVVYMERSQCATGGDSQLSMRYFNSTDVGSEIAIEDAVGFGNDCLSQCFPKIRHITVADYDNDGQEEYVLSYIRINDDASDNEIWWLRWIDVTNGVPSVENGINVQNTNLDKGNSCSGGYGDLLTSPLVKNLDDSTGNGMETIMGFMVNPNEYNIIAYDSSISEIDTFPSLQDADGKLISNVMFMDNNEDFDFCVLGYQDTLEEIDLLCASLTDTFGLGFDNLEFQYSVAGRYNITSTYEKWNSLAHSADYSSADTPNTNELLNSYGVFNIDWDTCSTITGFCDLNIIYDIDENFGKEDGAVIGVDYSQEDREDMLMLTNTNLFYFDDGFTNSPGQITEYTVNPCLDSSWKVNTTVNVQIEVTDPDSDLVFSNVTLYLGDTNEQTSSSSNGSSGTTFSHSFTANKTIGSSTLRLKGADVENPETEDIIDLSFSVAEQGAEFGDCSTTVSITPTTEVDENLIEGTDIPSNNSITGGVTTVASVFNLSNFLVWIILMFAMAVGIFWTGMQNNNDPLSLFAIIIIVEGLLIVMGTKLGFLNVGIVITLTILGIIAIGVGIAKRFTGIST